MFNTKLRLVAAACAIAATTANIAQADDIADYVKSGMLISPVVVTATRTEQNSFDLPVSIDLVEKDKIQDAQLQMTLSESLIRVPGITAQNRTQMAQDPQISTRGFGARSSFGVRGLRMYVDGIPLTMPDGIGQPGNIDLGSVKGIEVMRGPFSALYGSSSGGVVQLLTEDAPKTPAVSAGILTGSYGTTKENGRAAGTESGVEYLVNYSHLDSDGYRQHSVARKDQATAKFRFNPGEDTRITILTNWMDMDAQDPLGLQRTATSSGGYLEPSAFSTPQAVPTSAIGGDTRVSRTNTQGGINIEHQFNDNNSLNLVGYLGNRDNLQFLSLSATSNAGRASQIARDFWGSDLRWTNKGLLLSRPYSITAGLSYGKMDDKRSDVSAINGVANPQTVANLNRDEKNIASNFDQYIQAQWSALENIDLHAGVRHTKVSMSVEDNLVDLTKNLSLAANYKYRDSSGKVEHEKTTPVVGLVWKADPALNLYANFGKGFETPTFIEVAYSDTSGNGPNLGLRPSTSDNYEIGAKAFVSNNTRLGLALFRTDTDKEIVATAGGTYAVYTNAGKTKREGVEFSVESQLDHNITLYGAYSFLDAKFNSAYSGSSGIVASGNKIPGTYRHQAYGEVSWKYPGLGFSTAFEGRYNSKVYVDDMNSDTAPAYTIFNLRAGFEQEVKSWGFTEFARIENLFDKAYIGSVRVNDSNSRFFEPAAGRNWLIGLNASYHF